MTTIATRQKARSSTLILHYGLHRGSDRFIIAGLLKMAEALTSASKEFFRLGNGSIREKNN
jgi:hypothetical protein